MDELSFRRLGERLVEFAADRTERLLAGPFRGWTLPTVWGGHPVGADVAADLAFTISHLRAAGLAEIGAAPIDGALQIVLRQVDGPNTHSFFSYRVAETLLAHGSFADNHLLAGWTRAEKQNLRDACDSTSSIALLGEGLPRNYHAVLARCELGRSRLGLIEGDGEHLADLVEGTREMLAENPLSMLDDSLTRFGRYDIYTPDVHLFCEPLADRLGGVWRSGMVAALELVRRTASPDGSAVGWGRSTGALAVCLTAELAALGARSLGDDPLIDDAAPWRALAGAALDSLPDWFDDDGVITAHVGRSTYYYRGPERRLQMSVDCLGKIADAGHRFLEAADLLDMQSGVEEQSTSLDEALVGRDDWVAFDDRNAGAWIVRTPHLAFTLPVTGSTVNDYLPAPHQPTRLEVAVQNPLPGGTPVLWKNNRQFVGGGLPDHIEHGGLEHGDATLTWKRSGFPRSAKFEEDDKPDFAGSREVTWSVDGRSLVVHERWDFDEPPDALVWQWAETESSPMSLTVSSGAPHRVDTVDVAGLMEWRSFWGPLPRLHQVEFEPSTQVEATFRLTTKLRVASTAFGHHYHRSLYRPMRNEVADGVSPWQPVGADDPDATANFDLFHMHWPEWVAFDDLDRHRSIIDRLRAEGVPIIWTQHNLTPHAKEPEKFDEVYRMWAEAADGVIHHTNWGRALVEDEYPFRNDAVHRVIRHGAWRYEASRVEHVTRAEAEAEFDLPPCAIRFAIVGAPRAEKKVQAFMDGFARSKRDDVGLSVWSLGADDVVPDDPRITAALYEGTQRDIYDRRLRAVDVLVLPFDDGMLATGTAGDAIGHGLATMASDWGYLAETFGDAAIHCPLDPAAIAEAIDTITDADVARSRERVTALRGTHDWKQIGAETVELFDAIDRPPRRF